MDTIGKIQYVPQLYFALFEQADTVAAFLENRSISWPLVQASLNRIFGITNVTQDKEMRALSGGELAKLLIAIADTGNPDILLLDEPTNHLDAEGLEVLKNYLLTFNGAFIVVSHDPLFLDHVISTIWEIDRGAIARFGGNYSEYQEQKRLIEEARERDFEAAKKDVKKARRAIEARETRVARANRAGKQSKAEPSRDKFAEGFFRGQSEKTAGKLKRQQDQMIEDRQLRVSQLQKPKRKTTHVVLEAGAEQSKRMLVSVSNGSLSIEGRSLVRDIGLRIEFGDRIVFTGKNGSGKSLLVKALMGMQGPFSFEGVVKRGESLKTVYMDQKYQSIDPELSILDNLLQANPHLDENAARNQLGKFLFGADSSVKKQAGTLSGGETACLVLAQVTSSPIDLLVLDEPTNNLDIEALDIIADALGDFPGALVVISHNVHFLSRLETERAYVITGERLKEMRFLPEDEAEFYSELVAAE
ncbi:ATP-binding cassette domain-containing protein [Candidatus Kaiserbacteria bacterium]|nr:ATP-binding cassette domain-containing protein [Candidatus Kaiserbacteria bacterium]